MLLPLTAVALCSLAIATATGMGAQSSSDLAPMVARMAKIGRVGSPTFSPDGTRIAFVSDLTGTPQIWVMPVEGGWPTLVTADNDPVGFVEWSPTSDWLA